MIKIININKSLFNQKNILNNVNLNIKQGDFISIVGSSGSGKTSLLQILGLIDNYTSGDFFINGKNINNLKEKDIEKIRKDTIGFIFQNHNLISTLNVFENILIAFHKNISFKEKEKEIDFYLKKFNLYDKKFNNVNVISGGEAQRVSIIRAIINNPKILLCDEPTGSLDSKNSKNVIDILLKIKEEYNISIIIVTHDQEIANIANKKFNMKDGLLHEVV